MSHPFLSFAPAGGPSASSRQFRRVAALALRRASSVLSRLALRVAGPPRHAGRGEPLLEFCAEAGAPEGALYVDGVLVGSLPGVSRL